MEAFKPRGIEFMPTMQDHFVTWSSEQRDVRLLVRKETPVKVANNFFIPQPDKFSLRMMFSEFSVQPRCLDAAPSPSPDGTFAVGLQNGNVAVMRMCPSSDPSTAPNLAGEASFDLTERPILLPSRSIRHGLGSAGGNRNVFSVAWNRLSSNIIAIGLDGNRGKNEPCLQIWDITHTGGDTSLSTADRHSSGLLCPFSCAIKPLLGVEQERCCSISWFMDQSVLAACSGLKSFKIHDVRMNKESAMAVNLSTKISCIACSPHSQHLLATGSEEGIVRTWDRRHLSEPLSSISTNSRIISEVKWCTWSSTQLAVTCKDENSVAILSHANSKSISISRRVTDMQGGPASMSWIPEGSGFVYVQPSGNIERISLRPPMPICISPSGQVAVGSGATVFTSPAKHVASDWEESDRMKALAQQGYGHKPDTNVRVLSAAIQQFKGHDSIPFNDGPFPMTAAKGAGGSSRSASPSPLADPSSLQQGDSRFSKPSSQGPSLHMLHGVWEDVVRMRDIGQQELQGGMLSLLRQMQGQVDTPEEIPLFSQQGSHAIVRYRSPLRSKMLSIAGCGQDDNQTLSIASDLATAGKYDEAVFVALLVPSAEKTISILQEAVTREPSNAAVYASLSVAFSSLLSGVSSNHMKASCESLTTSLPAGYLRAVVGMLYGDSSMALKDRGVKLRHRLAFAARFLPFDQLNRALQRVTLWAKSKSRLEGILVTGLSQTGAEVLSSYVSTTGDVQTAGLLAFAAEPKGFPDGRGKVWLNAYRDLLDRWCMFMSRCELDCASVAQAKASTEHPQPKWRCTFCNKVIVGDQADPSKGRRAGSSGISSRLQTQRAQTDSFHKYSHPSACPHCRRWLPRCSVCLLRLGSAPPGMENVPCASWTTWCQRCRHGGHAMHLNMWFEQHSVCPVANCDCKCAELDSLPDPS